jgi:hypothetical protein
MSQDSGNSHSGSDDAPKSVSSRLWKGKKKKKKDKDAKHAAEKEAGPDRCAWPPGIK